jgi:hypothetical protein
VSGVPSEGVQTPEAFRAVLDSVFSAPTYRWAENPDPLRRLFEWWSRLLEWLEGLRTANPAAFRVLVVALLAGLLLALGHAGWVVWRTVRAAGRTGDEAPARGTPQRRDAEWFSRAADRAASGGRLAEALQLAFIALALRLEAEGVLQYHPGKTPAECARDARLPAADRERLAALVRSLYSYAFGGHALDAENYRRWREAGSGPWHAPAH